MYIPPANAERDRETLFGFIAAHPFGALVSVNASGALVATHIPWILHENDGAQGVLQGHIARANREHDSGNGEGATPALVLFTGPDAYISPSWYASKAEHGRVVPTWNYIAVHVYGRFRFVTDDAFLARHLEELVSRHEGHRQTPWHVTDAPADYIERQRRAIVGVELAIERIEGKWKMSQNRPAADVDGVIEGLRQSGAANDRRVAEVVEMSKRSSGERASRGRPNS
jgi:transcriptional regulator